MAFDARGALPDQITGRAWASITNRNYELFAKLAGVRGEGPEPNGVPQDVSQLARVQLEGWNSDAHSVSYLSLREFTKRYCTCEHIISNAAADRLQGGDAFKDTETICAGGYDFDDYDEIDTDTDVRIIFWFDN